MPLKNLEIKLSGVAGWADMHEIFTFAYANHPCTYRLFGSF